ncbi:mitochondrial phosphate carrier protein [Daldinia loculata]|uniref:mitochondrial phosphate carrier protein n=1 Tax=Daldinia loculata TaxID=103429 RepID=UPI0020C38967|nr:mitochondrial phosphate carrier protein [Daldinia loculata]KAI1651242.1 mitochondrial phosphate carrier protein [Daldinia loculata]KAI2778812.1 mitochondrial phosphate carrier protein [Daldinia loculata]
MIITRLISLTNFAVASSALGFQVFVLYPWHIQLDNSFEELKKEHLRVLDAVREVAKEVDPDSRKGVADSILGRLGMSAFSVKSLFLPKPESPVTLSVFDNSNPVKYVADGVASIPPLSISSGMKFSEVARYAFSGAICCSFTHALLTPVDVVKTRVQLEPVKYNRGLAGGMRQIVVNDRAGALLTGFGPTVTGYFLQGAFKFGGYEFFKRQTNDFLGPEKAAANRNAVYLASSAAAEFLGDILLCPFEAVRIRLVSQPSFAPNMLSAFGRMVKHEGMAGLYSGFMPIVLKQVPYTMATFVVYEKALEVAHSWINKETASNTALSGVNLGCGLIAGMAAAIVSQPADTVLSKINKEKGRPGEGTARRIFNIVSQLGLRGSYAGIGPRLVMVGGMTAVQFGIYGHIQRALGATKSTTEDN